MNTFWKLAIFAAILLPGVRLYGEAPKAMIVLSSAAYHAGDDEATAAAADGEGNILVTGKSDGQYLSVKYNKSLLPIQTGTCSGGIGGDTPRGIAVDALGNIIVCGETNNGADLDYCTVKFSPNFQNILSSAVFNGGLDDRGCGPVIDSQGKIFVTGSSNNGANENFHTIKYDAGLSSVAARSYDSGNADQAGALTVDRQNNIIVAGSRYDGTSWNYYVVKYDNDLNILGAASFGTSRDEKATGVAVDSQDNVIITGRQHDGATQNYCTAKYDANLVFVASAVYDSGMLDMAAGVAADSHNNIIVTGYSGSGLASDYFTIKYDANFMVLSSAAYNGGNMDQAAAVTVDPQDNIIVTGKSFNGVNNDYFTVKYNGSPGAGPATAYQGETAVMKMAGKCFVDGTAAAFSDPGITVGPVSVIPQNQLSAAVTVSAAVPVSIATVTVTNPNGEYVSGPLVTIARRQAVGPQQDVSFAARSVAGDIRITVKAGSFLQVTTMTVSGTAAVPPSPGASRQAGCAVMIESASPDNPRKDITITFPYRDEDIAGLSTGRLGLGYYDDTGNRWVYLYSTLNSADRTITGTTRFLNRKFAIVEFIDTPETGETGPVGRTMVYPNPYKPGSGGDFDDTSYGEGIVFAGLPPAFRLKVVNVAGELVLYKESHADVFGKYLWDTKNEQGEKAASGVYLYLVEDARDSAKKTKGKFSIIR